MRHVAKAYRVLVVLLLPTAALAQGKPLPAPSSDAMPPVELTINMQGAQPICEPTELRLPANTNVELHVISHVDKPVTITMPGQFANGRVLHADGDLVHVASEDGYLVKQNGRGTLRLRTQEAGQQEYACTSTGNEKGAFKGMLVRTSPNG